MIVKLINIGVSPKERKDYGFISSYDIRIQNGRTSTYIGEVIQKYSGHIVNHPTGVHRERIWIYEFRLRLFKFKGQARTRTEVVNLIADLINDNIEQCSSSNSQAAQQ